MKQTIFNLTVILALSASNLAWSATKVYQVSVTIPTIVATLSATSTTQTQTSGSTTVNSVVVP